MKSIRRYFQDYAKYFPEEWEWNLSEDADSRERYMRCRARKGSLYHDADKTPFFDSIEKDANQFGLIKVEFIDFFGIKWKGEKGRFRYVGDADYDQHLYYVDPEEEDDKSKFVKWGDGETISVSQPRGGKDGDLTFIAGEEDDGTGFRLLLGVLMVVDLLAMAALIFMMVRSLI